VKFRKKPEVVDAVQWNGENLSELRVFLGVNLLYTLPGSEEVPLTTQSGKQFARVGDWLVKAENGGLALCPPKALLRFYECFDFEFDGICGCCGFKEVPVKLMPDEKAYVCNVCLVEKTPQQRMVKYRENLEAKP